MVEDIKGFGHTIADQLVCRTRYRKSSSERIPRWPCLVSFKAVRAILYGPSRGTGPQPSCSGIISSIEEDKGQQIDTVFDNSLFCWGRHSQSLVRILEKGRNSRLETIQKHITPVLRRAWYQYDSIQTGHLRRYQNKVFILTGGPPIW